MRPASAAPCWTKDESRILSWSDDHTLRLGDVAAGRQIGPAMKPCCRASWAGRGTRCVAQRPAGQGGWVGGVAPLARPVLLSRHRRAGTVRDNSCGYQLARGPICGPSRAVKLTAVIASPFQGCRASASAGWGSSPKQTRLGGGPRAGRMYRRHGIGGLGATPIMGRSARWSRQRGRRFAPCRYL
jgi:hypothetical protein